MNTLVQIFCKFSNTKHTVQSNIVLDKAYKNWIEILTWYSSRRVRKIFYARCARPMSE